MIETYTYVDGEYTHMYVCMYVCMYYISIRFFYTLKEHYCKFSCLDYSEQVSLKDFKNITFKYRDVLKSNAFLSKSFFFCHLFFIMKAMN